MGDLSAANQRLVEISRCLLYAPRVVIMDEPSAALSDREVRKLFGVIQQLKADGVSVIYVSHRLDEIFEIGDRVTVLRDGSNVGTHHLVDITHERLVQDITGTRLAQRSYVPSAQSVDSGPRLRLDHVSTDRVRNVSLTVQAGEVVGLAGLVGSGRSETLLAIMGADPLRSGEVLVDGHPVAFRSPRDAVKAGVSILPEERRSEGLFTLRSIRENVTMGSPGRYARFGLIDRSSEQDAVSQRGDDLRLKCASIEDSPLSLSGGNQQKVVLARLLETRPRVLLLDEPTKGVDVGAKQEMFRLVGELAEEGVAVVFVSSDLDELEVVCHRALVFREGEPVGELARDQISASAILELAFSRGPAHDN